MAKGPLVSEQIHAGAKLLTEFATHHKPVRAAFWLQEEEEKSWHLYLASDQIDDSNSRLAYQEVIRLLGPGPRLWLDSSDVKVRGVDDPIVRAVMEMQRQRGNHPARLYGLVLDRRWMAGAFIYAVPPAAPIPASMAIA